MLYYKKKKDFVYKTQKWGYATIGVSPFLFCFLYYLLA